MTHINRLTLRMYGLVVNDQYELLLSDEFLQEKNYTKLPGGGLHFGESMTDCLGREFIEELGLPIEKSRFFHINTDLVISVFNSSVQVFNAYFLAQLYEGDWQRINAKYRPFDFEEGSKQSFRWVSLENISPTNDFNFTTDQAAVQSLLDRYRTSELTHISR